MGPVLLKFLNVNIITFKKVNNHRKVRGSNNVDNVFFVEFGPFWMLFWLCYYIFSSIKPISSYTNKKNRKRLTEEEEKILIILIIVEKDEGGSPNIISKNS